MFLTIKNEQTVDFRREAMRQFKNTTVEQLKLFAPKHFAGPGELHIRKIVDIGIERATAYGFTSQNAIRFYIEMMLTLGSGFDRDPMFPWAGEILLDSTISDQYKKTDQLYEKVSEYTRLVLGEANAFYHDALRRIRNDFSGLKITLGMQSLDEHAAQLFYNLYPQKYEYIDEDVVRVLIARAAHTAARHGVAGQEGWTLLGLLMFLLGTDVHTDPVHSWVADALEKNPASRPEERIADLYAVGARVLDHCLA